VSLECCKLGIPLRGIVHDLSKFLPSELRVYAHVFFDERGTPRSVARAWFLHQKRNDHHWEWWCLPTQDGTLKPIQMDHKSTLEMVADWRGAGRAQGKLDALSWYKFNKNKMHLHPETRVLVEKVLAGE